MKKHLQAAAAALLSAAVCLSLPGISYAGVVPGAHAATFPATETSSAAETAAASDSGSAGQDSSPGIVSAPGTVTETTDETAAADTTSASDTSASTETVSSTETSGGPAIGSTAVEIGSSTDTVTQTNPDFQYTSSTASFAAAYTATEKSVNSDYSLPGSVDLAASTDGVDLQSIFDNAGFDALGTGNTPADPVLGQVQIATYEIMDQNGQVISYTATNDPGKGLFNADGFSKFYMVHSGIARMYYRVYTDAHGWSPWCTSKETTPYNEDGAKVQAIQIRAKGMVHRYNDVYYRVMLNDGTVLDWAKNGQTTGTMGTDRYIVGIRVGFWHNTETFPYASHNLMAGCAYDGPYRDSTGTHYSSYNGQPYTGWAFLDNTQCYFVNGEPAPGWQYVDGYKYYFNSDASVVTDVEPILGPQGSYQINYNKATRTMYIMAKDGDNGYIIPYKTFNSACGPDTVLGDFSIYAKYPVKYMHSDEGGDIYCKYLNRFHNGYIIHSILFYGASLQLDAITYNYIDDALSGGCLRLLTGYAHWVYDNCAQGTGVHIYSDQWNKGPIEKDAIEIPIPRTQTWDPTDPSSAEAQAAMEAAAQADAEKAAAVAAGTETLSAEDAELANALSEAAQ